MTRKGLHDLSIAELVERFADLAVRKDESMLEGDNRKTTRLFWKIQEIQDELKTRPGDARSALIALYDHPNMQARLDAATATLAVAPQAARAVLEAISASGFQPQALDAGMTIVNLDNGVFKPT